MENSLEQRLASLERRIGLLQGMLSASILALALVGMVAWRTQEVPDELRARSLVLVDANGAERIVMGAPIPEPDGRRISRAHGLIINDADGAERFGVGLLDNGSVVMGFDAPPGVGSGGNRERLTFAVNQRGLAELRFLDSRSLVRAHMNSQADDNVRMFIYGERDGQRFTNAISAFGDTVIVRAGH